MEAIRKPLVSPPPASPSLILGVPGPPDTACAHSTAKRVDRGRAAQRSKPHPSKSEGRLTSGTPTQVAGPDAGADAAPPSTAPSSWPACSGDTLDTSEATGSGDGGTPSAALGSAWRAQRTTAAQQTARE